MLILKVSSTYKHTFALCDSLSLGGNLIAAGVDWRRGLHCPPHLESEVKLRLINIQRLVELECSRGVKYWTSMCTHTVCNISCFLIILAWRWHFLCCLVEFTSWYLCWTSSDRICILACPGLFFLLWCSLPSKQTHKRCFACKLIQTQHDYHVFHLWHLKPRVYMQKWNICRKKIDRLLSDMRWL